MALGWLLGGYWVAVGRVPAGYRQGCGRVSAGFRQGYAPGAPVCAGGALRPRLLARLQGESADSLRSRHGYGVKDELQQRRLPAPRAAIGCGSWVVRPSRAGGAS